MEDIRLGKVDEIFARVWLRSFLQMKLTKKQIDGLSPRSKRYGMSDGNGLVLVVEPSGAKRFVGRTRFNGKQIEVYLGNTNTLSLKGAREEWIKVRTWSREQSRDPRSFYKNDEYSPYQKTLGDAIEAFLENKKNDLKEFTLHNYRNQLENQVCGVIPANTPLSDLEWDRGGRQRVMEMKSRIEQRGSYDQANRVQKVLAQALDYAVLEGWMGRNQNPATKQKGEASKHVPHHHPHIQWEQVPELMERINVNRCSGHVQAVLALKFLLMTFLRAGTLVRLRWEWIDQDKRLLVIPGTTPGLKRTPKTKHLDHHVPLTDEMELLLEHAWKLNGHTPYVFAAVREGTKYPHLNPEAPNNLLKTLGYRDEQRAHGWRSLPLTAGQEVLKTHHEIIQRQMGHLIGDKVRQAYDRSLMLEERREFLERWCSLLVREGLRI